MSDVLIIRHLIFTSPRLAPAVIRFGSGLNLIYGPSNTGKSSILDAIDFMMGRDRALKEIPEHDGYEAVVLGVESSDDSYFTLIRSIGGGDLKAYDGLHEDVPEDVEATLLKLHKPTKKNQSLPNYLFSKIGLADKKLKRNSKNEVKSLTLRNLFPLFIINETEIQKENSPYLSNQFTERTTERSRLKFFLTGVDDSALVPEEQEKRQLSRQARLNLLGELISEQEDAIYDATLADVDKEELLEHKEELLEQKSKLLITINSEDEILKSSEADYRVHVTTRNQLRLQLDVAENRVSEIAEMRARFRLLAEQYNSDIDRLENLIEAGTLFIAFPSGQCPVCGSNNSSHEETKCDGDAKLAVQAAEQEHAKITSLRAELDEVLQQLEVEHELLNQNLPTTREQLNQSAAYIAQVFPVIAEQRAKFAEAISTKSDVERALGMFEDLERLKEKKEKLQDEAPDPTTNEDSTSVLPTRALHELSQSMSEQLRSWGLSGAEHVHFDKQTDDFVIDGKHRASNGKGHRALTHAAATLSLLSFTEKKGLPSPGLVVLDSPLLAYEKPEFDEENLSATDINKRFFDHLAKWKSRQVIVIENKKSIPREYEQGDQITHFTKSSDTGRYGFFPLTEES